MMDVRFERLIGHVPRLVLDVREWLGTVAAGGPEVPGPAGPARVVVRPAGELTVTASPTVPRDPRWPFAGPVDLVAARTPAGLLAFFGRVRSIGGGPLRRVTLGAARCDLRVEVPGYRPTVLAGVAIPAAADSPVVREVYVYPTGELPEAAFGPTVLSGTVSTPDGSGRVGVKVIPGAAGLRPAEADENGVWVLELDPPGGPRLTGPGAVDLEFRDPNGALLRAEPGLAFEARRLNRFPRTVLRGSVQTRDGRDVVGASVKAAPFVGETTTRPGGGWVFCPDLSEPLSGTRSVTLTVTAAGGGPVLATKTLTVNLGKGNDIPTIIIA